MPMFAVLFDDPSKVHTVPSKAFIVWSAKGMYCCSVIEDISGVDDTSDLSRATIKYLHRDSFLLGLCAAFDWGGFSLCQIEAVTLLPMLTRVSYPQDQSKVYFLGASAQISMNTVDSDMTTCLSRSQPLWLKQRGCLIGWTWFPRWDTVLAVPKTLQLRVTGDWNP